MATHVQRRVRSTVPDRWSHPWHSVLFRMMRPRQDAFLDHYLFDWRPHLPWRNDETIHFLVPSCVPSWTEPWPEHMPNHHSILLGHYPFDGRRVQQCLLDHVMMWWYFPATSCAPNWSSPWPRHTPNHRSISNPHPHQISFVQ